jgi:hypothetical protein
MVNSLMVDEQTPWISGVRHPYRNPYASNLKLSAKLSEFIQRIENGRFFTRIYVVSVVLKRTRNPGRALEEPESYDLPAFDLSRPNDTIGNI